MKIQSQLNNIFDQYDQPENRLTNAFLQTLTQNNLLLKHFLTVAFNIPCTRNTNIVISSQKKPRGLGDNDKDKKKAEGIPDGWIIVDEKKAIVFETKIVRNMIRKEQLLAHIKRIRGYDDKFLCVITPDDATPVSDPHLTGVRIKWFSWRNIYEIVNMYKPNNSELSEFMRIQLKEYLAMKKELVGFQGIEYSLNNFNSEEAKTIIKSLIEEIKPEVIRDYPRLRFERKSYSQDVHAYTVYHRSIWSFLGTDENFTKDMHLTFWLAETHMGIGLTIPNNARSRWSKLKTIFRNDELFNEFGDKLFTLRKTLPNLYLEFVHRHFLLQRNGVIDGILEMDFDTLEGNKSVKSNPLWFDTIRKLIANKRGYNGQFMIRTRFFHKDHPEIKYAKFKERIIEVVHSLKDVYDYLAS